MVTNCRMVRYGKLSIGQHTQTIRSTKLPSQIYSKMQSDESKFTHGCG